MSKKRRGHRARNVDGGDPLQEWRDWQDHQYLPGYWVGGKIPQFLLGKRPNSFGYLLIAGGVVACLLVGLQVVLNGGRVNWGELLTVVPVGLLLLGAGASLLRRG
jgi:hypothetical protein